MKVAIDGPAASGKSTIAKAISKRLEIPYLETGLAYRAMGYAFFTEHGIDEEVNWDKVKPLMEHLEIKPLVGETRIYYKGNFLSQELRSEEAGKFASLIGTLGTFREQINEYFRELVGGGQAVVEGRDAGTNIIPQADIKIFITASAEDRAKRRHQQLKDMGVNESYEEILNKIKERDERDSKRKDYPFKPAPDAVVIDTTGKSIEEVLSEVFELIGKVER